MRPADDAGAIADPRVLAAALQAVLGVADPGAAARAVLAEVYRAIPFAFGVVLRLSEAHARVIAVYPGPLAGIDASEEWAPLDAADETTWRLGEPTFDGALRSAGVDRSPFTRLPAFGLRSVLRVPLFKAGHVSGSVSLFSYASNAFSVRDGIALERYVYALGDRLDTPPPSPPDATLPLPQPEAHAVTTPEPPRSDDTAPDVREPERLSVLSELVAGVAHELNNPLTTILGYAQLLPTLEGEEQRRAAATIEAEAQRAGRIVRNLLYFARQHTPRVEPVDVNALLERVVEVRRYNLEANNVQLVAQLQPIPELLGDQYQLEQVFLNLVTNAQQALQPGSGGTITITSAAAGDVVRVSVSDTGPGVPEELASRIFEPFFTTRDVGEGAGLGLSIAYGIVQAHGGRLHAERASGGGARFVVELPLPPQAVRPAASAGAPGRGRGERVLVVEDEAAVRALVSAILGSAGYAVQTAQSGVEALNLLGNSQYDLVISDVRMPGIGGETLLAQISERWPDVQRRMLFISGDVESEHFASLLRERGVRYLEKPFTTNQLLAAAREVLDSASDAAAGT